MEYCYSGTESLWYGSWNRHVCRKGKCAADRHSRSTGVNPSRKQRCCSPSYLWSQGQLDTFDPDNYQSLGYWLITRHRCICMWMFKVSSFISFEFWLSCVIDSFILRNLFPTITWTSIWRQIYWIAKIDHLEFYSLLLVYLLYLHFIFLAFLVKTVYYHSPSLGSPNSKSQSVSNSGRTSKSFRLTNRINRWFSKISTSNARRCLTCHHISCKSTITSSINGKRYGIQIDKNVDWNSSNLIYVITWEARGCGAQYVDETSQSLKGRFRSFCLKSETILDANTRASYMTTSLNIIIP